MKLGGAPVHKSWHPKRVEFLEGATLGAISSTHAVVATRDGRVLLWQHGAALGKVGDLCSIYHCVKSVTMCSIIV